MISMRRTTKQGNVRADSTSYCITISFGCDFSYPGVKFQDLMRTLIERGEKTRVKLEA